MAKIDPKTGPRSPQDRPKTALRRIKKAIVFYFDFIIDFWSSWAPSWRPLGASWVPPESPDRAPVQGGDRFFFVLGSVLAPFWAILGPQGVVLGSFGRPLGHPRRSRNRPKSRTKTAHRSVGPSCGRKMAPRPPKTAQDGQSTPQNGTKRPPRPPQEAPSREAPPPPTS